LHLHTPSHMHTPAGDSPAVEGDTLAVAAVGHT